MFNTWPALFRMRPAQVTKDKIEEYKQRPLGMRAAFTASGTLLFLRKGMDLARGTRTGHGQPLRRR